MNFNNNLGLKRNQIIIAKSPVKPELDICKRIIHLQGEQVHGIKIPPNHVWIEGDNKDNSFDSRDHGKINLYQKIEIIQTQRLLL